MYTGKRKKASVNAYKCKISMFGHFDQFKRVQNRSNYVNIVILGIKMYFAERVVYDRKYLD